MDLVEVEQVRVARSRSDLVLAPGETVIGGGTWVYSEPQPGTTGIVDLAGLGWEPLDARPDGGVDVAATCTLAQLRDGAAAFGSAADLVRECVEALLGSWKIHRVATVGGNICLALPAGPMTSLAAGLGATGLVWGPGDAERRLPIADLVVGPVANALEPGEVLRAVEFPPPPTWAAMRRASLIPRGRSGVLVVARLDLGSLAGWGDGSGSADGSPSGATFRVTVTAAVPAPRVLEFAGIPAAADLAAAVDAIPEWFDDPHGAPDWRHALTRRFAEELRRDAVRALDERAAGDGRAAGDETHDGTRGGTDGGTGNDAGNGTGGDA